MTKIGEKIDQKLEEKELKAVNGHEGKGNLRKAELLGIKFVTSEKGVECLKQFQDMFNLMDGWEKQKQDYQRTIVEMKREEEKEPGRAEAIETLTFHDGIILVREIFHRIIDECFDSDEKDRFGFEYAPSLYDKMEDILENNVLNHVRDHRAEHLHELFGIRNSQYIT